MLSKIAKTPYERIVQWVAGPVAGAVGFGFTELVTHVGVVGTIAHGHEADISRAIVQGTTFLVSTGVTYAAHHKWLSNLQAWWNSSAKVAESVTSKIDPAALPDVEAFVTDPRKVLEEIIAGQKAAAQIQDHPELLESPQTAPEQAQGSTDAPVGGV